MKSLTFVHLTDLHVGDPSNVDERLYSETSSMLKTILAEVKRIVPAPAFIAVSGDLTNAGDVGSYDELKRIFAKAALEMPVLFALGNHDTRAGFYRSMMGAVDDDAAPYDHATVIDGLQVVVLDTSRPRKIGGSFDEQQAAWLEAKLSSDQPTLIVMHHAPALDDDVSLEWESLAVADTERFRQVLAGRQVVGILSGHIHFDRVSNWHGIPVVVGIGQHAATDVLYLPEGLRMVSGASFAIGTLRPSGLTVSFVPQPTERRELKTYTHEMMAGLIAHYEGPSAAGQTEGH